MIDKLKNILKKKERLCIGLMSGTSMDGVDTALVKITGSGKGSKIRILDYFTYPYPNGLKNRLLKMIRSEIAPLSEVGNMNFLVGEIFADAVQQLISLSGLKTDDIDLIGSHGQTLWHQPAKRKLLGKMIGSTLQIGEPSVIQARTGIITIADFRTKDMALGGEGAPLIPYFDHLMFSSEKENTGLLNLGGIANITVIPAGSNIDEVYAFDTGPGNMVIDSAAKILFDKTRDTDGKISSSAEPDKGLLRKMSANRFIRKSPPKSTGREEFGLDYTNRIIDWGTELSCTKAVIVSTITEFTALSIYKNYEKFIKEKCPLRKIIVSGGGVYNQELMDRIRNYLAGVDIESIDDHGIPPDIKEAVAFAVFANETISGNPVNLPAVTGAEKSSISGKIII
ncbi:MAG: anhydro-N-acetylmuramic acid kinase [bacterium]|nr:anhydro-N-acetylmuramic acid kinase [bacterium]